jgi:predicted transcriptional regulator of viral defense system
MNLQKLRKITKIYFGYEEVAKVLGISLSSARVSVVRFVNYGLLVRLKRNMYVLKEVWESLSTEDKFPLVNIIQVPSYISLMTALSYYQATTQMQRDFFESICIKRTKEITIDKTTLNYMKIDKTLYFGFLKVDNFFIASAEKAFLDAAYLASLKRYSFDKSSIDFRKLNKDRIKKLAKRFPERTQTLLVQYGTI